MIQFCQSCKYYYKITDSVGVCCATPGRYVDLPYERRACRFYEEYQL